MMVSAVIVFLWALLPVIQAQSLTSSEPVVTSPGQSVSLSCKVQGLSLAWLHWIRQKPGRGLEWIGRIDGVRAEVRLEQTSSLVKRPGESVKMSCITSGYSMTSNNMHWIRQKPGQGLEWIGRMNTGNNAAIYGSSFQSRFTLTENVPSSTQYMEITESTPTERACTTCLDDTNEWPALERCKTLLQVLRGKIFPST
ncbi:hypothetical protein WMY93_003077 [Mugilogobius chulae]|uniref:Ig-like domain-containing protein n=1 Tax=Mugilogobius chulae TaxID=88201 RepID=A0AAW0Q1C9_9GOBI